VGEQSYQRRRRQMGKNQTAGAYKTSCYEASYCIDNIKVGSLWFDKVKQVFMEPEFYSIKETAVIFAVHENTIRKAIRMGFIAAIRIGNCKKSPYRISKKTIGKIHITLILELEKKSSKLIK